MKTKNELIEKIRQYAGSLFDFHGYCCYACTDGIMYLFDAGDLPFVQLCLSKDQYRTALDVIQDETKNVFISDLALAMVKAGCLPDVIYYKWIYDGDGYYYDNFELMLRNNMKIRPAVIKFDFLSIEDLQDLDDLKPKNFILWTN